jgi:hypothetical protein
MSSNTLTIFQAHLRKVFLVMTTKSLNMSYVLYAFRNRRPHKRCFGIICFGCLDCNCSQTSQHTLGHAPHLALRLRRVFVLHTSCSARNLKVAGVYKTIFVFYASFLDWNTTGKWLNLNNKDRGQVYLLNNSFFAFPVAKLHCKTGEGLTISPPISVWNAMVFDRDAHWQRCPASKAWLKEYCTLRWYSVIFYEATTNGWSMLIQYVLLVWYINVVKSE